MKITMTPAQESDRAFYVDVHHQAYRALVSQIFGWDEEVQDGFANRAFDDGDAFIIFWHDECVGVVSWCDRGDDIRIVEIMILPEFQGEGIGSHVLKEIQKEAQARKKPLRLQTVKANQGAYNLYIRHGLREEGETATHFKMIWYPPVEPETEEVAAE